MTIRQVVYGGSLTSCSSTLIPARGGTELAPEPCRDDLCSVRQPESLYRNLPVSARACRQSLNELIAERDESPKSLLFASV